MVDDRGGYDDGPERREHRSGRDPDYPSVRDYAAAGRGGDRPYGQREYGHDRYDQRERMSDDRSRGGGDEYRGSYAGDGRRFAETDRDDDRGGYGGDRDRMRMGGRDDDRGFLARAGDEVRSWFGDDDAERRRDRAGGSIENGRRVQGNWSGDPVHDHRDRHYHSWRESQIAALDRDYDEYRREHQSKFENEFASWRTGRQTQRQMLEAVDEHQEVVGSDGEHVGTVDKVRGDRIILTKNDPDAGGHHHSIPSSWLRSVENGRVMLSKSADEAKRAWRDEERQGEQQRGAMFGQDDREERRGQAGEGDRQGGPGMLNRSFSGTY